MKKYFSYALVGAIALTGAVGFSSCSSSSDEVVGNNPDYNPELNSVKTQFTAVQNVISTYRNSLECGAVDPDVMLPEFLKALEDAGINDIIAANQKDLDAWIAENK